MINFCRGSLIAITILYLISHPASAQTVKTRHETWLSSPPLQQLYSEGLDDQKGMGRIFVPSITNPNNEPFYAVFRNDELVGERNMGASFFLLPGAYTVVLGSGTFDQRIHKDIEVRLEETVIIEPDWCALTIEIIDESRNNFRQDLQVFDVTTATPIAVLPSINPELGEQLQTLLLPPGLYKILKRGRDFNTFVNFATVLLEAGSYTPFTIVIDSQTGNFTGAGIIVQGTELKQIRNFRIFAALHGNVVVNSDNKTSRNSHTDLSILAQLENRLIFDRYPHYHLSNNLINLGTQKLHQSKFTVKPDFVQLKNTYIYYILKWLGGYGRLDLTTHILPTTIYYDTPRNITLTNANNQPIENKIGVKELETAPPLYPLELKEGAGVNLTPIRTFTTRVNIRAGFGFRQSFNQDVYQPTSIDTVFRQVQDIRQQGFESSLVSYVSLPFNIGITTEVDVLFPFGKNNEPVVDLVNFTSLSLTKNVTFEHTLRMKHDRSLYTYNIVEQLISVRLSYYIF